MYDGIIALTFSNWLKAVTRCCRLYWTHPPIRTKSSQPLNSHRPEFSRCSTKPRRFRSSRSSIPVGDHSESTVLKKYLSFDYLLIDEIGYVEVEPVQVGLFFTLMHQRHKKKPTLITSN